MNTVVKKTGSKIRQLREARNIPMEELAKMSELEPKELEAIEEGDAAPSMSLMIRITRALGIRLGTILDGEEISAPVITRDGEGQYSINISKGPNNNKNHDYFSLAIGKSDRNMEPFIIDAEFIEDKAENYSHHEGEEFIFILDGDAELHYGVNIYKLGKGDSIYYDSLVPHYLSSSEKGSTAKILAITYTPF